MPGYSGPGSAAHHPRFALRAPEGKLVPGPRYGADPGMLRCARDDSRDTCDAYAIALPHAGRGRASGTSCAAAFHHELRKRALEHDPEKWVPVFGKDHAPSIT